MTNEEIRIIRDYEKQLWDDYKDAKAVPGCSKSVIEEKGAAWGSIYSLMKLLGLDKE